ncbi:MAG TPA: C25 family cysteine peptidase [Blastocatellia bacterium]|nr:C25 family cysteine peptidase [Blastocatellia bacterium]
MKTNNDANRTGPSLEPQRKRAKISVIIILSFCLAVLAAGAALPTGFLANASAAIQNAAKQNAAKRTVSPAPKPVRTSKPSQIISPGKQNPDGSSTASKIVTDQGIERTMDEITADQQARPAGQSLRMKKPEYEVEEREERPDGPGAIEANQWPLPKKDASDKITDATPAELNAPQTLGTQFDGATGPTETGAFPPDTMGAVGPTQFFVFLNGRMRTFNKTTGVADGVINVDSDVFFASVITPPGAGEVSFTSDPQVRFDRLSNRWFVVIIDVVLNAATGATTKANRILIAVNDAASNGTISGATVWTFFQFQGDATLFTDYESLGIDASALYIGGDMFTLAGSFNSTKGFVVPKAPALTGGPLTVWAFTGLVATPTGAGPFAPRGVDNYDPANTGAGALGYFIGVDNATFNTLMIRRVTNPGSLGPAPTISANISVATPLTTRFPVLVPHLGNTAGTGGRLDALDDRLYAAHLRNGRLWTAHNVGVNNTGVAGATNNRNAARWYELQNLSATPSVLQSGTLFDNNATNDANQRNYWIPAILVSGQGHAALGCSIAGTNERINAFTTGRLTGDTLGTLRDGPGGVAFPGYTASATAYNPPGDPGGPSRRWGDYSFTSLDPKDDMTMWTVQEYCNGTNTYAPRVVKLIAPPPPPTNTAAPAAIPLNNPSISLVVTGTAPAGQGFYDPGPDPAAPHTPFNHISASGAGIIVNSITFNTPTQVTINVSTVGSTPGSKTITITNPDGQTTTVQVLVGPTAARVKSFDATNFDDGRVLLQWRSDYEVDNLGYNVYREVAGQRTKLNPQIIAGSALVTGANVALTAGKSYAWADLGSRASGPVTYVLEDINLNSVSTFTGPIGLKAGIGRAPNVEQSLLLNNIGNSQTMLTQGQGSTRVERKASIATPTPVTTRVQLGIANDNTFKIPIKQEGWYRLSQSALIAAGLPSSADPRKLQLFVDGTEVPIVVTGEGDGALNAADTMQFFATGINSAVTAERVYWLVSGKANGLRIPTTPGLGGTPAPGSFLFPVERKDRTIYFSGLKNGEVENFFGPVVNGAGVDQVLNLKNVAASAPGSVTVEVAVQGVTLTSHQVGVTLNGTSLGTVSFSNTDRAVQSFTVAQSLLSEGDNTVRLASTIGGADISLVDSVRITYWHTYQADSNQLFFTAQGGQRVTLNGFTDSATQVVDVTNPNAPQLLSVQVGSKSSPTLSFTVQGTGVHNLYAFAPSQMMQPVVKANVPSILKRVGLSGDYIIITHASLKNTFKPLVTLRKGDGLSVILADVEDIFDEFSFGNKSPQAIKDYLEFAKNSFLSPPRFVLMAGEASLDPKNYLGLGDVDLVPTKLIDTTYMESMSEDWFCDFNSDGLPEIAMGRLPARTPAEMTKYINKIVNYNTATPSNSVLLFSDSNDGYDFATANNTVRQYLPASTTVVDLRRGSTDDTTMKAQLLAGINGGHHKIISYNGHGTVGEWRGSMLNNDDAVALTNQPLTFFSLMTCLNGYFTDPGLDSLAERLLKADNGGAVAVWASAGQCEPSGQAVLNQELHRLLFGTTPMTIGEAAKGAKAAVVDGDIRRTWILFGDPAMRLR